MKIIIDRDLVLQALAALEYHVEQTRPIWKTSEAIAALEAALAEPVRNEWKEAVVNELITAHIYSDKHDTDPRKAVQDAISWNVQVALDPLVSSDAQALIDRGAAAALAVTLEKDALAQQAEPGAFDWPRKACPCRDVQHGECTTLGCKWERDPSLVPEALRRQAGMQQAEPVEPVTWTGCGECDCLFPCHEGKTRCLRLPVQEPVQEPVRHTDLSIEAQSTIGRWLSKDMDQAVANGANSISMPDELVEIAVWLDALNNREKR